MKKEITKSVIHSLYARLDEMDKRLSVLEYRQKETQAKIDRLNARLEQLDGADPWGIIVPNATVLGLVALFIVGCLLL